ncbi:hypothetical protein WA026_011467 [Henosepilachna vigintioctopunctata]|uniref:Uncharacterized protein n=1 Tax=Henosepilachna vigintioctopunctata TaxID=420089 RepID=A0AAW1TTX4_9CUCU
MENVVLIYQHFYYYRLDKIKENIFHKFIKMFNPTTLIILSIGLVFGMCLAGVVAHLDPDEEAGIQEALESYFLRGQSL